MQQIRFMILLKIVQTKLKSKPQNLEILVFIIIIFLLQLHLLKVFCIKYESLSIKRVFNS